MTAAKFLARLYKLALALSAATAHAQPPAPFADDRKIPVDRWEVVSVEPNGKPIDPELLAILQVIYRPDRFWAAMFNRAPEPCPRPPSPSPRLHRYFNCTHTMLPPQFLPLIPRVH